MSNVPTQSQALLTAATVAVLLAVLAGAGQQSLEQPAGQQFMRYPEVSSVQVIIGAPYSNGSNGQGAWAGEVYAVSKGGYLLWSKEGDNIPDEDGHSADTLGWSVGSAPNIDGNHESAVVIGSPQKHIPLLPGRVHVYSQTGKLLWNLTGNYSDPPGGDGDFGFSVSGVPDLDGDRKGDVIVGGPQYWCENGPSCGKVFVYSGATGGLLWTASGSNDTERFGWSVTGMGDLDGDGLGDVAVGAPQYHAPGGPYDERGKIYVYSGGTGAMLWTFEGNDSDHLGWSLDGVPDVDGDQVMDLVVGAPEENDLPGQSQGYISVYSGATGDSLWTERGESTIWNSWPLFGWSVAGLEDLNADGVGDIVVGAPDFCESSGFCRGKAYVYSGADRALLWSGLGEEHGDAFGMAIARSHDLDGDGRGDFVIASPKANGPGGENVGEVYAYSSSSGGELWRVGGVASGDLLGWSAHGT